jgi:glycerate kinase
MDGARQFSNGIPHFPIYMKSMRLLIAPNAFKNSLKARAAAEAIRKGFEQSRLPCTCECFPIADGGDGTGELLVEKLGGSQVEGQVDDPLGRKVVASFGLIATVKEGAGGNAVANAGTGVAGGSGRPLDVGGSIAVIEMAAASGLHLLRQEELDPLRASTIGTGQLIRMALDRGVRQIMLAVGGSATVDGGAGILHALGIRFLDGKSQVLAPSPRELVALEKIDRSGMDARLSETRIVILCDVTNRLLGAEGAAQVFGAQKGAGPKDMPVLEAALTRLRDVALAATGKDMAAVQHGGAAGGVAAGLYALLDADLVNGAEYFLGITGFDKSLDKADLVITGEGSIDEQTLQGKGPYAVACHAKAKHLPMLAFAGMIPAEITPAMKESFDAILAIGRGCTSLEEAIRSTGADLTRTAMEVGDLLASVLSESLSESEFNAL